MLAKKNWKEKWKRTTLVLISWLLDPFVPGNLTLVVPFSFDLLLKHRCPPGSLSPRCRQAGLSWCQSSRVLPPFQCEGSGDGPVRTPLQICSLFVPPWHIGSSGILTMRLRPDVYICARSKGEMELQYSPVSKNMQMKDAHWISTAHSHRLNQRVKR